MDSISHLNDFFDENYIPLFFLTEKSIEKRRVTNYLPPDAIHDVYIKMYEMIQKGEAIRNPRGIYTLLLRQVLDGDYRENKNHKIGNKKATADYQQLFLDRISHGVVNNIKYVEKYCQLPSVFKLFTSESEEFANIVNQYLSSYSKRDQQLFILRAYGYGYDEIAQMTNMNSSKAVGERMSKIRGWIKKSRKGLYSILLFIVLV